jgi:hypothetical protein
MEIVNRGDAMNLNEVAAMSAAQDIIERAQSTSALEQRALAIVDLSVELHRKAIDLRLQAEEILKEIRYGLK